MADTLKARAGAFVERWRGRGDENSETQQYWMDLLGDVLQMSNLSDRSTLWFERRTAGNGLIDALMIDARVLVEQKSLGVDLDRPEPRQGVMKTPIRQALDYANALPPSERPTVLITCNFSTFRLYDLETDPLAKEPQSEFTLERLPERIGTLRRIFGDEHSRVTVQQKLSEHAGVLVADLHNALAGQYANPDDPASHHALATLTVRMVFALYAEDAGLFPAGAFSDYVKSYDASHLRRALIDLFDVLDTKEKDRDPYLEEELKRFPYVNGGLFHGHVEIPPFTEDIRQAIVHAGETFSWREISPVIFGSLMEETLSHDQRRKGGMHYTTVKNIHRVIDPLFLDRLNDELDDLIRRETIRSEREREERKATYNSEYVRFRKRGKRVDDANPFHRFRERLGNLSFLDPACGSGNFLTESYLRLRELENKALYAELGGQGTLLSDDELVKVHIDQFHGIEINDFAVSVAKTALWIAEQQALDDTENIVGQSLPHLPLHDSGNIVQANALRYDWNQLLPAGRCSYVMGNPPFVGRNKKSDEQIRDMQDIWGDGYDGNLDYATCWFARAARYLSSNTGAAFAFVSTNSICQGIQVPFLFKPLHDWGWRIDFAHRTFAWDAQSTDLAHVHVVIIGMRQGSGDAALYTYPNINGDPSWSEHDNVNGYLFPGPDVFVVKRTQKNGPLSPMLSLTNFGSMPRDGGNLIIDDRQAYEEAMSDPIAAKYVLPFRMGRELINGTDRWCLWMVDAEPSDIKGSAFLSKRVNAVKAMREESPAASTRSMARTGWLFGQLAQPCGSYLAIPKVFSGRREYATCDWYTPDIIAGDMVYTCDDPDGFAFAIIESRMFMAWQKTVGGKLKSDCRFSNTVVWNTLPLPQLDDDMRTKVIDAGREVLAARANHPGQSLADLYDPDYMPADLRKAHQRLDRIADVAFGATKPCKDDDERLAILFRQYAAMTSMQ